MPRADDRGRIAIREEPTPADGPDRYDPPIEPGHPTPENVLFVLLGVVGTLAVVFRLVALLG